MFISMVLLKLSGLIAAKKFNTRLKSTRVRFRK
jgi:hypothetical protein